mmetsp:Transcript_14646/g.22095  ORF Transcript_14646/g.22095 Transcript_14646/m.22095 type:complete len:157 (-) Transcript_14646:123-593(-)|eukprot:CAMPEP_0185030146 /NCGR_PEP_ID=MMETSP1103-20130426/16930_1 /TAXON_ID=36769 /ORGANISM="Paraphysomonas bandaiensis, Strain Caron Lab Isolate" /LENGTH=156 /DNA_ID=CAMNT_0027565143 /DNA_START=92 /DNA_END=562 /DNA_ORIENTATION=+
MESIKDAIQAFISQLPTNPIHVVLMLFLLYRAWQAFQPFPGENDTSGPQPVTSVNGLDEVLANKERSIVVIDFYATWCGPCKVAAPSYKKLAENPEYDDVVFLKCNVDKAADVAKRCGIKSMPTFKVFSKGKEVETILGYNEQKIRDAIRKIKLKK